MPPANVHVVLNPESGGGRAGRALEALRSALRERGIAATLHCTAAPGDAVELAHSIALEGAGTVIAAGGDGTVHDVVNGIMRAGTATALGVIPLGTGNDFAKVIPGARDMHSACDVVARGQLRRYDVGHARWNGTDEFFVNGMGTGIDVEVVRQILGLPRLPGPLKYLAGLFRALAVYRPVRIRVLHDSELMERAVMMLAVGNGICQGGGFYLTPDARPDDGKLELCMIESIPLWQVAAVLPRVLRGTHATHAAVTMRSFESIRFEAQKGDTLYFQLDGELRESRSLRVDVAIQQQALNVITA